MKGNKSLSIPATFPDTAYLRGQKQHKNQSQLPTWTIVETKINGNKLLPPPLTLLVSGNHYAHMNFFF